MLGSQLDGQCSDLASLLRIQRILTAMCLLAVMANCCQNAYRQIASRVIPTACQCHSVRLSCNRNQKIFRYLCTN